MSALVLPILFADAADANPSSQQPGPIVSCTWLESHNNANNLVILDIRSAAEYAAGHIRNSINAPFEVPFSAWITMRDDLLLELPDTADLFGVLSSLGITRNSRVVIVTSFALPPYPLAGATRVADTLRYVGVRHVSILDGGYPAWVAQGKATTTDIPAVAPSTYAGTVNATMFVDIAYVHDTIGTSLIVDARDANVYSGEITESWADKPGHIPTAISMPAPLIWNADGTYKSRRQLQDIVDTALGAICRNTEVIVYCGVGGYGSSWLFVLTEVLGYANVKLYDGSAQEWVRYYDMVM